MKKFVSAVLALVLMFSLMMVLSVSAFAVEDEPAQTAEAVVAAEEVGANENDVRASKAIASAVAIGVAAAGGAIGMGMTISKSAESMARQPEMASKINSTMMLGIVFIETAIIYALVVAILIIFVL